jgi:two-component system, OmpR family, sensor histidine kinase KdpD
VLKSIQNYAIAVSLALGITLVMWLLRNTLTLANFSLIYLLYVLMVAIQWGTLPSLLTAIVSFLCFNFFLIPPLYTFIVADPREVIDLMVFLIVAIVTGQLAANLRQQTATAQAQAHEKDILYKLTSTFNQITTREGVHDALTRVLQQDLAARHVHILPYADSTISPDVTVSYLLLRVDGHNYGTLRVAFDESPTPPQARLVNACVAQAAMALHRIRLIELARQRETFEEADRLKTALLHAVSHDLRTPITIIKTSASNLLNLYQSLPDEERVESLKAIETEADQLNKMVGNLLDMSRLQAGALQLNSRLNALEEVAGDVAARAWQLSHTERIKITFPDEMPLVHFDYGLILQALTNLVENALRYEPAESKVEIRGSTQAEEAHVAIINHGPPIPLEEQKQIMEPFYHGKDGHVGLGLPIARGIIEAHHGQLWVEDTPGGGATFVFSLPMPVESVDLKNENPRRG